MLSLNFLFPFILAIYYKSSGRVTLIAHILHLYYILILSLDISKFRGTTMDMSCAASNMLKDIRSSENLFLIIFVKVNENTYSIGASQWHAPNSILIWYYLKFLCYAKPVKTMFELHLRVLSPQDALSNGKSIKWSDYFKIFGWDKNVPQYCTYIQTWSGYESHEHVVAMNHNWSNESLNYSTTRSKYTAFGSTPVSGWTKVCLSLPKDPSSTPPPSNTVT